MKITNVEVHGLEDAILASGFAFRSDFDPDKISDQKSLLMAYLCGRGGNSDILTTGRSRCRSGRTMSLKCS